MSDKFCDLCDCDGAPMGDYAEKNYPCPLLDRNICETCCQAEVMGGMGAPDTFLELCKKSERTPQEAHAACVACPNGGPGLDRVPKVIYIKPGTEDESREFEENWQARLDWLNRNKNKNEKENDGTGKADSF
jgi:hypothetical protein